MRPPLSFILVALMAAPALAQDAGRPDPIGAAISQSTAAAPTAPPPAAMPGAGPAPALPPGAIALDQAGRTPDGPMSDTDLAFEQRLRQSVASAEGLQGPLDGEWTLYGADGKPLYVFMFVDPAGGRGPLEAAWRDLRRPRGADDLGVVDSLQHAGPVLTLNFAAHPGATATVVQLQGAGAAWNGQITEGGTLQKVSLRRN
ncbi:hypothetical protein ACO2Q3_17680 [Caulobacter sp. KR2-114]|uniref:hypothetical protein n=1 Tax=Caulobacter sp. KR2-114 TaxID=3400912 RepID=UPI003BFB45C3